jgi:hypothetical protein
VHVDKVCGLAAAHLRVLIQVHQAHSWAEDLADTIDRYCGLLVCFSNHKLNLATCDDAELMASGLV